MSNVNISSPFSGGVTIIPNQFIEHYMIHANGEFVKIYLYLMHVSESGSDFPLSQIADAMNCTESDVLRAIKYWEKEGLLTILPVDSRRPESISLIMPMIPAANTSASKAEQPVPEAPVLSDPTDAIAVTQTAEPDKFRPLTADRVKQLKENSEIAELLFIAQQYLGKTLTPMETNRLLFFYEELHFSTDLIVYLIEYCVDKGHRSMNYIEKVAFAWKEEGITNVDSAKKASDGSHKDYYTILKALGIRGRNPIAAEISIMKTWLVEYGFSLDIIVEACTRTILTTKQPSLQYADRILRSWRDAGVHNISDIQKLDLAHEQSKASKNHHKTPKTTNRFSNFEQRSYDYESLESQLLNR